MENNHSLFFPGINMMGIGCIKDLPMEMLARKYRKALVVTDKNLVRLGIVERVETILKTLRILYSIYDGIEHPNPTVTFVEEGRRDVETLTLLNYDVVISVGGGTNHDCAKAIAAVATNGGSIIDYEGYDKIKKAALPIITVNTLAGSGTEITMFAIIGDKSRKTKMTICDARIMPAISVNDPLLMSTAPADVTASAGIDGIIQGVEAYISTEASPLTDALALKCIELGFKYLLRACENGNDMEAREQMAYCSAASGMAFNNAGLGYIHSISHQLGGRYNQIHGVYNSILFPHVFSFNAQSVPEEKLIILSKAMGLKASTGPQAVDNVIRAMEKLFNQLAMPSHLGELGIKEDDFDIMANQAVQDLTTLTNPRRASVEEIKQIMIDAF